MEVGLDWERSKSNSDIIMTLSNSRFTLNTATPCVTSKKVKSTQGTSSDLVPVQAQQRSILSKSTMVVLWPIERMMKWFGCSKRMASSTVSPANMVRDVEYLCDTNNNINNNGNVNNG